MTCTASDSAAVTSAATSVSGRGAAAQVHGELVALDTVVSGPWRRWAASAAITGRTITVSRKFALYWIQSQTTRVAARSASDRQSASTIGAMAARAPADSRSRWTARMSISTRVPSGKSWTGGRRAREHGARNGNWDRFRGVPFSFSETEKFRDPPMRI